MTQDIIQRYKEVAPLMMIGLLILGLAYWVSSYTEALEESEAGVFFEQERPWQAPSPQVRSSERSSPPGYEKVNGIAGNLFNIALLLFVLGAALPGLMVVYKHRLVAQAVAQGRRHPNDDWVVVDE